MLAPTSCALVLLCQVSLLCLLASCNAKSISADSDAKPVLADAKICDNCPAAPVFINAWGGLGTAPGQFVEPSSVELESDGTVIVAGHEDRIQRFSKDGELIDIIGVAGPNDGEFNHPHGLAVDRDRGDLIYVGDQENHRLQVFNPAGQFVRQWGDPEFAHIHDVGIDRASGDLFVGDLDLHQVRKFSATGELLATFGELGTGPGQFNGVWGISTDSLGFVYIADTNNRRIQKFTSDGDFVAHWSGFGGEPFSKPTGVYVDTNDAIYVCDSLKQLVLLFDTEGTLLSIWDLNAIYGERSEPEDIVIDAEGKHIYIGEVFAHKVLHLAFP